MKGKFDDKLAQLAFGELSSEEARRFELEVQNDPEAQRTLMTYREMREGLKGMSEVPEDQFSKERLRDAILAQGLKPLPPRPVSNRGWLWMPALACALGFGIVFAQKTIFRQNVPPAIMLDSAKIPSVDAEGPDGPLVFKPVKPTATTLALPQPAVRRVANNDAADKLQRDRDPNEFDKAIMAHDLQNDEEYDPNLGDPSSVKSQAPPTRVAITTSTPVGAGSSAGSSSTGPIVLIDEDKDAQTGACKATEVGSSSNVLVGG